MKFLIPFDERADGKDYAPLYAALRRIPAQPTVGNAWVVNREHPQESFLEHQALRKELTPFFGPSDRIVVLSCEWGLGAGKEISELFDSPLPPLGDPG